MANRKTFIVFGSAAVVAGCARNSLPSPALLASSDGAPRGNVPRASQLPAPAIVGEVRRFDGHRPPRGWMICDGRALRIAQYPELYAVLGESGAPSPRRVAGHPKIFYLPRIEWGTFVIAVAGVAPTSPKAVEAVMDRRRS